MIERSPLRAVALAQVGGLLSVLLLVILLARGMQIHIWRTPLLLAILQGATASMISLRQKTPRWWLPIHFFFAPLVVIVHGLDVAPGWFLAAFTLMLMVFWRTDTSRVPLYLTNRNTAAALLKLLPAASCQVIDLGCGDGGLLRRLALARPDCQFIGIEHAPLTWLVARLRAWDLTNLSVKRGDFWHESLHSYGVVYAFLSPTPMPRLWKKWVSEMAPDALLVSNSFAVPDVAPTTIITVNDRRATHLYLYRHCQPIR